jgi:hypothetical protein
MYDIDIIKAQWVRYTNMKGLGSLERLRYNVVRVKDASVYDATSDKLLDTF